MITETYAQFEAGCDEIRYDVMVDTIPGLGNKPYDIAYDPVSHIMYTTNQKTLSYWQNTISLIDTTLNRVIHSIPLNDDDERPEFIAYDPVYQRMYVTTWSDASNYVLVIDTTTYTLVDKIRGIQDTIGIAYDSVNLRMYVSALYGDIGVGVIDTTTNQVTDLIKMRASRLAYDPNHQNMYVSSGQNISVIDTTTNRITDKIPVGFDSAGMTYDPVNERMYVANYGGYAVSVIDTNTNKVIVRSIPVGNNPNSLAYDPVNQDIYVTNSGSNTVSVIDTTTNTVIGCPIPVGDHPQGIAYDPVNERMYVANYGSNTVSVIYLR